MLGDTTFSEYCNELSSLKKHILSVDGIYNYTVWQHVIFFANRFPLELL